MKFPNKVLVFEPSLNIKMEIKCFLKIKYLESICRL